MQLIPKKQRRKMLANGVERAKGGSQFDPHPVVKLFMNPASVWLLDSISPHKRRRRVWLLRSRGGMPRVGVA